MAAPSDTAVDRIDQDLVERLRARGQRVTSQRLVINRMLHSRDAHVTAEDVLNEVSKTLPGTSLPTIYATLELLEQLGLVRRVAVGSGAVLFDPRQADHHHLVCRACGAVQDLDAPVDFARALDAARAGGFAPDRPALVIDGLCERCAAGEEGSAGDRART